MASHFAVLVNGENLIVRRGPRNGAARIGRIGHSSQLDGARLANRIVTWNLDASGIRKDNGDVIGISGVYKAVALNFIRNDRRAGSNSGNGHGFTIRIRDFSNARIVGRPSMRIPSTRLLTGQFNRLADLDRLFRNNGCRINVSVVRRVLVCGHIALAGCRGVDSTLVGLRLIGGSPRNALIVRNVTGGRVLYHGASRRYLRNHSRLRLRSRLSHYLNGNV